MTAGGTNHRIRHEVSGGIARIMLARPPVNALDMAMVRGARLLTMPCERS